MAGVSARPFTLAVYAEIGGNRRPENFRLQFRCRRTAITLTDQALINLGIK
jgi:hypothetical protein